MPQLMYYQKLVESTEKNEKKYQNYLYKHSDISEKGVYNSNNILKYSFEVFKKKIYKD
jgi:hypothetical protein